MPQTHYDFCIYEKPYRVSVLPPETAELSTPMGTACYRLSQSNTHLLLLEGLPLSLVESVLEHWLSEEYGAGCEFTGMGYAEAMERAAEQGKTLIWEMGMDGVIDGPFIQKEEKKPRQKKGKTAQPKTKKMDYSAFAIPKPQLRPKKKRRKYTHMEKTGVCAICGAHGNGSSGHGGTVWHHILYRSQGGGENKENLIEVGDAFLCACHRNIHAGFISKEQVLKAKQLAR